MRLSFGCFSRISKTEFPIRPTENIIRPQKIEMAANPKPVSVMKANAKRTTENTKSKMPRIEIN